MLTVGLDDPDTYALRYAGLTMLGAAIGDLLLAFGAWDGIYLGGPLARTIAPRLPLDALVRSMQAKDAFRRQLAQAPIATVAEETGAASEIEARLARRLAPPCGRASGPSGSRPPCSTAPPSSARRRPASNGRRPTR